MKRLTLLPFLATLACTEMKEEAVMKPAAPQQFVHTFKMDENNFLAELSPLNKSVVGEISGAANFRKDQGQLFAYIRLFNSLSGLVHEQRFYLADSCPTIEADLNEDGFIDITEANAHLGQPLFPLDYDLTSEAAQYDVYPGGDAAGSYWYEQVVDLNTLLADIAGEDLTPENDFAKTQLPELDLNEGVILIMGVPAWTILPETVASSGGYANFQTLPIACGTLRQIYQVPGRVDEDRADPLPGGEVGGNLGQYDNAPVLFPAQPKKENYGEEEP